MSATRVRRARPADAPALLHIEEDCFVSDRIAPRQMRYLLTRAKALNLVVETTGGIVGYCSCLTPAGRRPARLYSLAVVPACRGAGLAGQLLTRLLGDLRNLGYGRVRLEVRASDTRTRALYARFGFREIAQLPEYYEDGEVALRMEVELPGQGAR